MPNNYRGREGRGFSTDSESENSLFNNAFKQDLSLSSANSNTTNFTSAEAILPTDTDESDFRRLVENDIYLRNVSEDDTFLINRGRSPSVILAAGTNKGSNTSTSIESLQSTIINGALDSEASFYTPRADSSLTNSHFFGDHILDKRLSSDEEFKDCESSLQILAENTPSCSSLNYKSLRLSENNNVIFNEATESADSEPSENSDSGFASNAAPNLSSKYPGFRTYLQHLTTIIEESTVSNTNSQRISGFQLVPIIESLRRSSMPQLPQTETFNATIATLAQILEKSSREITVDQLAEVLLYTLQTDYSYASEHSSEADSFFSYAPTLKLSDNDLNNTGMDLDSILEQLRSIHRPERHIESESSPDWYYSSATTTSKTPKYDTKLDKVAQSPSGGRRREYFPLCPSSNIESNKENLNSEKNSCSETVTASPKKNKVRFSPEVRTIPSFKKNIHKPQKKKYLATPHFKGNENHNNTTIGSEDSLINWEDSIMFEERTSTKNLRRSSSLSNIFAEESRTSEVSRLMKEIGLCQNRKVLQSGCQFVENKPKERVKRYRKRRSRSVENNSHLPVQARFGFNHDFSRINANMLSIPGIERKRFPNQENGNFSHKPIVRIGDTSSRHTPTLTKIQDKKGKSSIIRKSPVKSSSSRKSFGIDSSHILAVSQLRKVFSPARRAQGSRILHVPRIEITKSSPEKSVNGTPISIMELHRERSLRSKSKEKNSLRKPWRP